ADHLRNAARRARVRSAECAGEGRHGGCDPAARRSIGHRRAGAHPGHRHAARAGRERRGRVGARAGGGWRPRLGAARPDGAVRRGEPPPCPAADHGALAGAGARAVGHARAACPRARGRVRSDARGPRRARPPPPARAADGAGRARGGRVRRGSPARRGHPRGHQRAGVRRSAGPMVRARRPLLGAARPESRAPHRREHRLARRHPAAPRRVRGRPDLRLPPRRDHDGAVPGESPARRPRARRAARDGQPPGLRGRAVAWIVVLHAHRRELHPQAPADRRPPPHRRCFRGCRPRPRLEAPAGPRAPLHV
ncbi:MAG: hypothetical protein AVDCRST_MAG68-2959, partial [uncultured Gemmatimonadetes bacterium]